MEHDDSKLPFDQPLMVYFRKRLTPEIPAEINEFIIDNAKAKEAPPEQFRNADDDDNLSSRSGTIIADAACVPSRVRHG